MEDKHILELYWERNPTAIDQTVKQHGKYCAAIARNILENEADVEECVNDALLAAWSSIPPKRPENLGAYLGKLTRSKAIDRWRALRREKRGGSAVSLAWEEIEEVIPDGTGLEDAVLKQELVQAVRHFLASLSETERNVFLCRYWYFEEISTLCTRFGFTRSKVHSMLHRTRNKLKRFLQKEDLL